MKKKNSGFTLVEILAVIVVLAIIVTLASNSVVSIMNKSRKSMAQEVRNNLKEVALIYSQEKNHLTMCELDFNPKNLRDKDKGCYVEINVETLKNAGLFEDDRGFCDEKEDYVIVYRYSYRNDNDEILSEYKAYVSEDACNN